eukprot:134026_1
MEDGSEVVCTSSGVLSRGDWRLAISMTSYFCGSFLCFEKVILTGLKLIEDDVDGLSLNRLVDVVAIGFILDLIEEERYAVLAVWMAIGAVLRFRVCVLPIAMLWFVSVWLVLRFRGLCINRLP